MSTLNACFTHIGRPLDGFPIVDPNFSEGTQKLTTSTSSQIVQVSGGGADWTAPSDGIMLIYSTGPEWVVLGTAPTAVIDTGTFIPGSWPMWLEIEEGQKIAVIDG